MWGLRRTSYAVGGDEDKSESTKKKGLAMSAEEHDSPGLLAAFSKQLAEAVASAGASVVRVEARRRRAASGIIWGQSDLVLTADHVVERDEDLAIGLPDGGTADASIVGRDPGTDLALLRVSGHDTPAISLGV